MSHANNYVTGMALSQFVHGAASLGVNTDPLLQSAGLSVLDLQPTARVSESKYEMVLLRLMALTQNPRLGVEIGQQIMPPLYGVLMSLAFGSLSLGDAITYLARYQGLATGNCGDLNYVKCGERYKLVISMAHTNPVIRRLVSECVMTFFSCLPKVITGRSSIVPESIEFQHSPYSKSAQLYIEKSLNCPVHWSAKGYNLTLSLKDHLLPIFGHGEQMLKQSEELAQIQLEKIRSQQSILEKIAWHVEEQMIKSTPRRDEIAKRLNISTRTLDRRLKNHDTSWQELLDQIRLKRSMQLLETKENTIAGVAEKLGFADVRSFQRKFKNWTGLAPSEYRNLFWPSFYKDNSS